MDRRGSFQWGLGIALLAACILLCGCRPAGDKPAEQAQADASAKIGEDILTKNLSDIARFEQALKKSPDDQLAKNNLMVAYMKTGSYYEQKQKFGQAIVYYRKALALDEGNTQILRHLGVAQFEAGKQGDAIKTFKRLCELKSDEFYGHYYLGQIYSARGELDLAIDEFGKALAQNLDDLDTNVGLMLAYKKKGDMEKAAEVEKRIEEIKNGTYIPDRGHREKLGRDWREQFLKDPKDYRALYNFAASQFDKLKFYLTKSPSELSIGDLRVIRGSMSGINAYVKLAKDIPEERPYYRVIKRRRKKLSGLVEKKVHALRAEYARKGEPLPKEVMELPPCSEASDLLKKVMGDAASQPSEDEDEF